MVLYTVADIQYHSLLYNPLHVKHMQYAIAPQTSL